MTKLDQENGRVLTKKKKKQKKKMIEIRDEKSSENGRVVTNTNIIVKWESRGGS